MTLRILGVLLLLATLTTSSAFAAGGGGGGDSWGPDWSGKPKAFLNGVDAIGKKDFALAVQQFTAAVEADPNDADAANFLGYSYRKTGDYPNAVKQYERALSLKPKHRGAHEYLGEAYLEMGNLAKAKEHLAALDDICWLGCDEYSDLKAAVQAFEKKAKT